VMSGPELAAQAIANIAPSAVIAFTAAAIYLSAGRATILSVALATVAILTVGAGLRPDAAPSRRDRPDRQDRDGTVGRRRLTGL
jgi:hypothetical protein